MGDQNQLPCIGEKSMISEEVGKANSADAVGRIVIHDFLHSKNDSNVKSTVVVMEDVIRQTDRLYLSLLQNMTNDTMEDKDVEFIKEKCLDQLSQEERDSFKNAIHLVPQWKMAHPIVKRYLESLSIYQHQLRRFVQNITLVGMMGKIIV